MTSGKVLIRKRGVIASSENENSKRVAFVVGVKFIQTLPKSDEYTLFKFVFLCQSMKTAKFRKVQVDT